MSRTNDRVSSRTHFDKKNTTRTSAQLEQFGRPPLLSFEFDSRRFRREDHRQATRVSAHKTSDQRWNYKWKIRCAKSIIDCRN
jgi:hypothetical protein